MELFIKTGPSPLLRWGWASGTQVSTKTHGTFAVRAYGRCSLAFHDVQAAVKRFASTDLPETKELEQRLERVVAGRFGEALASCPSEDIDILDYLRDLDLLRDTLAPVYDEPSKGAV